MANKKRVTDEERKMAFEGVVPPGRTEEWRKYFVRRQKWEAKRKASGNESTKLKKAKKTTEKTNTPTITVVQNDVHEVNVPAQVEVVSESVIIGA